VPLAKSVGLEKIADVSVHHLRGEQPEMDWDVWSTDGAEPKMVRLVPDIGPMLAQQGGAEGVKIELNNVYQKYQINQKLPANAFKFVAPKGAEKVESLAGNADSGQGDEPAMALKGKPAPQFVATKLNGEGVVLKDHIGKHVVVLDFWATWCPPCRRALPTVAKITSIYADKGVVFYAVNQGDEPKDIIDFLVRADLDRDFVVLDKTGAIGKAYFADAIPQMVIIGADGVVRDVHIGVPENLEKELTEQLDAAVAAMKNAEKK